MRVMFNVTDPLEEMHTMTKVEGKASRIDLKGLVEADGDFLRGFSAGIDADGASRGS